MVLNIHPGDRSCSRVRDAACNLLLTSAVWSPADGLQRRFGRQIKVFSCNMKNPFESKIHCELKWWLASWYLDIQLCGNTKWLKLYLSHFKVGNIWTTHFNCNAGSKSPGSQKRQWESSQDNQLVDMIYGCSFYLSLWIVTQMPQGRVSNQKMLKVAAHFS